LVCKVTPLLSGGNYFCHLFTHRLHYFPCDAPFIVPFSIQHISALAGHASYFVHNHRTMKIICYRYYVPPDNASFNILAIDDLPARFVSFTTIER